MAAPDSPPIDVDWRPVALVAGCGAFAVMGNLLGMPWMVWVFKPLTTAIILVMAWGREGDLAVRRQAVLAGLALSWVGDVALMFPGGFLAGLVAFLLAHLAYLWAFTRRVRLLADWRPWAGWYLVAGGVLWQLWPGVGGALRVPVVAYVLCLASMAAQAACWWLAVRRTGLAPFARRAALGGALFVASDATLAWNRFLEPVPAAALWILGTYWAAQLLIAASLRPLRPQA
jgi:uncharacterized membrane protein YhhN